MNYCKNCVQPDTRPGIEFDEEGLCPPCQYMDSFKYIDWKARQEELKDIIAFGKQNNSSGYDCIIGVSGGKDSTRQAVYVREQMGLKPLLVSCTYPPEQQTERGADNLGNLIALGFDTISVGPKPQVWKRLMRQGFLKYGNWARSTEMALFASVPRVAIAYQIPLILWGENPALQLGDLAVGSLNWDGNKMKNQNTIVGGPNNIIDEEITEDDLFWYHYPSDEEMEAANLKIVYLGYFWKDWSKTDNADFSTAYGLDVRDDTPENMGAIYPFDALDDDFVLVNQMMKYIKLGFGKVTDEVSEQIRIGNMTREEGVELVHKYDGKCSQEYIDRFCRYLEITEQQFWDTVEKFRNQDIWRKDEQGQWQLKVGLT